MTEAPTPAPTPSSPPLLRSVPTGPDALGPEPLPSPQRDQRVQAVLDVLAGAPVATVAATRRVEPELLERWVHGFVEAGTAVVTNRPTPDQARQRDRYLAAFAHEVRTPLTVARGWAAMLADGDLPPASVASSTRKLHDALHRLSERALDVELLAKSALGRLTVTPRETTAGELLGDLVGGAGSIAGSGPDTPLHVDRTLFRRVVRDLWDAAHLDPVPREVRLEAGTTGPWTELRIVRSADPIQPAVLQALFEPFDLNDDDTGVTIGLYLARALTVAHGGTLGVEQDDDAAVLWVRVPSRAWA